MDFWSVTPPWFREAYRELRRTKRAFTLQIITQDSLIPWEYMRPSHPDRGQLDLLVLEHPVARRFFAETGNTNSAVGVIPDGRFAVVAPRYPGSRPGPPLQALAGRDDVVRQLKRKYKALEIDGQSQAMVDLLADNRRLPIATVYYYGHGTADPADPGSAHLLMEDADLAVATVRGRGALLGRKCNSFVVLNACDVATTAPALGFAAGWPTMLLDERFGGVLAPLWQIDPSETFDFCNALFAKIADGKLPIAEALFKLRSTRSPNVLSLLYFGDVDTVFKVNPKGHS
jgi:hypothetical protein